MKLGSRCIAQKSWPSSRLGSQPPWVRTPKMSRWATTLEKLAQSVQLCHTLKTDVALLEKIKYL